MKVSKRRQILLIVILNKVKDLQQLKSKRKCIVVNIDC